MHANSFKRPILLWQHSSVQLPPRRKAGLRRGRKGLRTIVIDPKVASRRAQHRLSKAVQQHAPAQAAAQQSSGSNKGALQFLNFKLQPVGSVPVEVLGSFLDFLSAVPGMKTSLVPSTSGDAHLVSVSLPLAANSAQSPTDGAKPANQPMPRGPIPVVIPIAVNEPANDYNPAVAKQSGSKPVRNGFQTDNNRANVNFEQKATLVENLSRPVSYNTVKLYQITDVL